MTYEGLASKSIGLLYTCQVVLGSKVRAEGADLRTQTESMPLEVGHFPPWTVWLARRW